MFYEQLGRVAHRRVAESRVDAFLPARLTLRAQAMALTGAQDGQLLEVRRL
jgi:hypothetical protein